MATINQVREAGKDHRTLRVYGQEVNLTTASIARMNLFLHEIEDFDIKRGDTLRAPAFKENSGAIRQFDVVIANPPFSLEELGRRPLGLRSARLLRRAAQEQRRLRLRPAHGLVDEAGDRPRRGGHAARRAVPRRRRGPDPAVPPRAGPARRGDRPALKAVLLNRLSRRASLSSATRSRPTARTTSSSSTDRHGTSRARTRTGCPTTTSRSSPGLRDRRGPRRRRRRSVRLVPFDEIKANGFDLNIGRYINVAARETADLGTALVAYAEARQKRLAAERAMFERLAAIGIDLSVIEVPGE